MKAPKVSFDSAKVQKMLLLHVEKIVLGVVILAVLWFVYQGATLQGLDPNKSPDKLAQISQTVTTQINDPKHVDVIVPIRNPNHPVTNLVKQGQIANAHNDYRLPNGWKTPDYPKAIQRVDPRNFAPGKPTVHAYYGPLATIPTKMGEEDPILAIQVEEPAESGALPRQPTVRPQPSARQPRGEGAVRPPGPGPGPNRRQPGAGMLDGGGGYGQLPPGYGEMGPRGGMLGMQGGQGNRALPPEAMVGFRNSATGLIAKEAKGVVVVASVPFEKQVEEYEKAFKDALDYEPMRDIPRYASFVVERADVTDNPEIDPAQATWTALQVLKAAKETALWGPSPNEIVDLAAIDPILTHRVPPFLQRELYDVMIHPDIPKAKLILGDGQGGIDGQPNPANPAAKPGTEDDLLSGNPAGTAQGATGVGEGSRMQPGVRPGGYGPPAGYGQQGFRGMPRGGYGEGAMPGGIGGSPQDMKVAKFKLVRFTDMTVEPLRKYRYRVKLLMEDPNNPYAGNVQLPWDPGRTVPLRKPSTQSMSGNVITRIQKAEVPGNKFPFLLESEPSEPSDVIELPPANKYFAGKATPGGGSALKAGTPVIYTSQPSATILTVEWDQKLAVDVPAEKDVFRGSTLNFEKEVEVIHPAALIIHPIGKYQFKNNSIVLDFSGGNDIPAVQTNRSDTKVPEPCEMLIIDGLGNLQLLDETSDVEGFRRYLPPKVEEPKASAVPGGFGPEAPAPGGILDGPRTRAKPGARREG